MKETSSEDLSKEHGSKPLADLHGLVGGKVNVAKSRQQAQGRNQKHLAPGLPDIGQVLANDPLVNQVGRHRRQVQITCNLY